MVTDGGGTNRRTYVKIAGTAGAVGLSGLAGCTGSFQGQSNITIAATIPRTGQFSSLGQDLNRGYRLGVQRMNEQFDRPVELILQNDESDPRQVRQKLQQITSNNDVNMIWGSFSSLLVTAGSAFAEQQNLPFLGIAFAYQEPHTREGYEWTFAPFPKSRDVARATKGTLELIPEGNRPNRIGIWEPNSGWGNEQAEHWEQTLSDAGYNVVLRRKFQLGSSDFSTLISRSKSNNVEVLLSNPTPPGAITAMKQMKSNNYAPKFLKFVRGADPTAWWSSLGQDGAYAMMCPGWVPGLTGNGNTEMRNAYAEQYALGENELLPVMVGGSYNLTQVASQAVQAAGSTNATDIRNALRNQTFHTVIGDFSFEQNGLPAEGELTAPVGQWWEGGQHLAYPDTDSERAIDLKYPLQPWGER